MLWGVLTIWTVTQPQPKLDYKSSYSKQKGQLKESRQTFSDLIQKVSTGCEEHIQLQQQRPQEMISVKAVLTTIKLLIMYFIK